MKASIALLPTVAAVMGCAASAPYSALDWDAFVKASPGQPLQSTGYAPATTKELTADNVAAQMATFQSRFKQWCSAHAGMSGSTANLMNTGQSVSAFRKGLAAKGNAEQVRGQYSPTYDIVCVDGAAGDHLVAAMVSEQGRASPAGGMQGGGYDRLTLAYFDNQQAADFASLYAEREDRRSAATSAASRERIARQLEATRRLRLEPRPGDRTLVGTIIEVRPPLALVQYDERYRSLGNRPAAEWLRIDGLSAPAED